MSQNHIIKTQILDFTLAPQENSFNFQNELSTFYYDAIIPIIEECFDSLSDSSAIHRIERLEIDLGNIHPNNLRYEIKTKIAETLSDALKKKILSSSDNFSAAKDYVKQNGTSTTSGNRKQELLEFFLKKGRLPWWVKKDESTDIPGIMESLLESNPAAIKDMMCMLKHDRSMLERTVNQFSDGILARILDLSSETETTNAIMDIIIALGESEIIKAFGAQYIRSTIWKHVLGKHFNITQNISTTYDLFHSITSHLSEIFQVDYKQLHDDIEERLRRKGYHSDQTTGTSLLQNAGKKDVSVDAYHNKKTDDNSFDDSLATIHKKLNELISPDDKNDKNISLKAVIEHFEKQLKYVMNLLHKSDHGIRNDTIAREEAVASLFDLLSELLRQDIHNEAKESIWRTIQTLVTKLENTSNQNNRKAIEAQEKAQFSDTEEIYVSNAGLVLFWPYINKLFEQCGLIKDKSFIDREKQNHAVFLLQYLSRGKDEAPEYELMLNKILCGLHPDFPMHSDAGITESERLECENLTDALIKNWPALKSMSVQGLRDTFVTRDAMIYSRDGHYVMRVEEKGYDILIDKMPWGLGIIKLPWMDDILYVEWRL
jgi:hypothetical protein